MRAGGKPPISRPSNLTEPDERERAPEIRLKMVLLWLHSFEEPFYSRNDLELLARPRLFNEGKIRFVGVMCCLVLKKELP